MKNGWYNDPKNTYHLVWKGHCACGDALRTFDVGTEPLLYEDLKGCHACPRCVQVYLARNDLKGHYPRERISACLLHAASELNSLVFQGEEDYISLTFQLDLIENYVRAFKETVVYVPPAKAG